MANLDGVTILRYAHIFRHRTSGGVEQYLHQLNDALLANSRLTILQMHLVPTNSGDSTIQIEIEKRGQGQIVWIPVCVHAEDRSIGSLPGRLRVLASSSASRRSAGALSRFAVLGRALRNTGGHLWYPSMILSEILHEVLDAYKVDLIVLHRLSYDVGSLISLAVQRRIPYAIVHHFDNGGLEERRIRRWLARAAAVGGVSTPKVPLELQDAYVNLSDAVNCDFFSPARALPVTRPNGFVVFLPGRITEGKGHLDLLLAAEGLVHAGVAVSLVFAGAIDSEPLMALLKMRASEGGGADRVIFLGELTSQKLRDWYAACDVVVLPSSSEGLPRVLLEAQAMKKPVLAYESGGIPDALVAGLTGYLVKTGDYIAMSERLLYLMNHAQERKAMGESGRAFVSQQFSLATLTARHQRFYLDALT